MLQWIKKYIFEIICMVFGICMVIGIFCCCQPREVLECDLLLCNRIKYTFWKSLFTSNSIFIQTHFISYLTFIITGLSGIAIWKQFKEQKEYNRYDNAKKEFQERQKYLFDFSAPFSLNNNNIKNIQDSLYWAIITIDDLSEIIEQFEDKNRRKSILLSIHTSDFREKKSFFIHISDFLYDVNKKGQDFLCKYENITNSTMFSKKTYESRLDYIKNTAWLWDKAKLEEKINNFNL